MRDKIKNIEINGWTIFNFRLFDYLKPTFIPHYSRMRASFVIGERQDKGTRFYDDETIFHRIISGLWRSKFEPAASSLTLEEIEYLINKAMDDCSRADWHYTYEKEWD